MKTYTYICLIGKRIVKKTTKAKTNFEAIVQIRKKYPAVLHAGHLWVCTNDETQISAFAKTLKYLASVHV